MLEAVTLDQIRILIAAVEEGSFSATAKRLNRAQSSISQSIANLELQLGVKLFDRSSRLPVLTNEGRAILRMAKEVAGHMDSLKALARSMGEGVETELSVSVDVMYPMDSLTRAIGQCYKNFPNTRIRLYVEALGGVIAPVLDGRCRLGVIGSLPTVPELMAVEPVREVNVITVVSPSHPLAQLPQPVSKKQLMQYVQLVLTARTPLTHGKSFGVVSPLTWLLADMGAKHAFLRAGFGWGHMPSHMVEEDLAAGHLIRIHTRPEEPLPLSLAMRVVYCKDTPPGQVGRAFIKALAEH